LTPIVRQWLLALALGLLAALAANGILLAGARWLAPQELSGPVGEGGWTNRARGWFTAGGFYSPEIDLAARRRFSWTGKTARIDIAHLDRSQAYEFSVRVTAARPRSVEQPLLTLSVDGTPRVTERISNRPRDISCVLPPDTRDGASILLEVSNTFVAGPMDKRVLGAVIDDVRLTPMEGHFRPSHRVLALMGLAITACVAGVLWCGFPIWAALVSTTMIIGTLSWLTLQDGAFIGVFVERIARLGVGAAVIGAVVGVVGSRWSKGNDVIPNWAAAIGVLLGVSVIKLAFLAHPLAMVGDSTFQVHRAEFVHAGRYFFTSVTPRPFFEFPYAVGLYVVAMPLWRFFPTQSDQALLLRGVTVAADALAGFALYAAVRRQWLDARAAFLTALLWPMARAPMQALCNANLTNAFGQSVFAAAMGATAWAAAGASASSAASGVALLLLTVAFLSHFSTLSVGIPIVGAAAVLLVVVGGTPVARRVGLRTIATGLLATVIAIVVYYGNPEFRPIYRKTVERVVSGEGEAATRSIVAPVSTKLRRWLVGHSNDYGLPGVPMLLCASAGMALLVRQRRREAMTIVLTAWAAMWLAFSLVGIVSPVEMRANLAMAPVFVCCGVYLLSLVARRGPSGRAFASAAVLLIAWDGIRLLLMCIGRW
jgi:hypothetical protein